jgi:hypothetical protein
MTLSPSIWPPVSARSSHESIFGRGRRSSALSLLFQAFLAATWRIEKFEAKSREI